MCPSECPGLADVYGEAFQRLYESYEAQPNRVRKVVQARDLWFKILDAQMETGTPSLLYKDSCNQKSNQKNIGVIKSSNLCTEIIQYSSPRETAVCNLASISLASFVKDGEFDYAELLKVTKTVTKNLNRVIDVTYYPSENARRSNVAHRPIGIGVQGLADTFFKMDLAFYSKEAIEVNKLIFETMYYGALEASVEVAKDEGAYESFADSPMSKGVFQFDMWSVKPSERYDWEKLRNDVQMYGVRNSLLVAPMPTASTSQILGNNECFEPITSNLYTRRTNAGEFIVINQYLVQELIKLGVWNESIKNSIVANHGSVQHLEDISSEVKKKYLTVWEIPMRHLIDMARDRGAFVCQSQSLNLFMADPDPQRLTSMHFYAWKQGLKTGMYYLRRKPRYNPQQVTLEPAACLNCSA
jgi:ribonucleoside-diphosphate reductase alpha chain